MTTKAKPAKQALEGTRLNAFGVDPEALIIIGYDTEDGTEHPLYDERVKLPLEESMVLNILVYGVFEPLLVRKNGHEVEVVDGRRRVLHAREANKRLKKEGSEEIRVPVMVRKGDDASLMGVQISANEIRRNDELVAKAIKAARYVSNGRSEQEAAVAFGMSGQTIKNWLKLVSLDPKLLKAVEGAKIHPSAAWGLANLTREEQRAALDELLAGGGKVTVKKTSKAASNAKARNKGEAEGQAAPGKRLVTKVLKLNHKAKELNADFVKGVMWVLGDIGPRSVAGLSELIREASGGEA